MKDQSNDPSQTAQPRRMTCLVTRPEGEAADLVAELAQAGIHTFSSPVLNVELIEDAVVPERPWQAILATSRNAIRYGAEKKNLRGLPWLVVGRETAKAGLSESIHNIRAAGTDVDGLLATAATHLDPEAGPILYLRGVDISRDLVAPLQARGFEVSEVTVYRARKVDALDRKAEQAIRDGRIDAVLHFSPRSASHFVSLCAVAGLLQNLQQMTAYCISRKVADAASENTNWRELRVAESPTRGDILTMITDDLSGAA